MRKKEMSIPRPSLRRTPTPRPRGVRPILPLLLILWGSTAVHAALLREREPNDTPAAAQPLAPPLTVGGHIDPAGDVDLFSFRGEAGQTVTADLLARGLRATTAPGSTLRGLLQILAADGTVLTQAQSLGDYDDPTVSAMLPASGIYYVAVRDVDPASGGPGSLYLLSIEIDPNDQPAQAAHVLPPVMISLDALIDPPGDQDCYLVSGQAGQVLTADVDAAVFNPDAPTETVLTIYDPAQRVLARAAWSLSNPIDPFLQPVLPAAGDYAVCVREVRGFVGTKNTFYQLSLDLGPAADNDAFATGSPVVVPRVVSGLVGPTGDRDLYRFGLASSASLLSDLDAIRDLQSLLQGTISLQTSGTLLASSSSSPDPSLLLNLPPGAYAASVTGGCTVSGCLDADRYYALTLDNDPDGDGLRLPQDNCPAVSNLDQADRDGDGVGDACDACVDFFNPDPNDGRRPPLEAAPQGLSFDSGSSSLLVWPSQGDALGYNLYRGVMAAGGRFAFSPSCLADNLTTPGFSDSTLPSPGDLVYYEVDAENQCAEGPFGADSSGGIRSVASSVLCPLRF